MNKPMIKSFQSRLGPACSQGGFRMKDYWVWCGSVVQGEDGRYHMFAARWPKEYPFYHGYLAASEVVRAVSDTPEGPYTFAEVVLPERGAEYWDGRMTHNPFIVKRSDEYLLFYIGTTYEGERPDRADMDRMRAAKPTGNGVLYPWFSHLRIGMARSTSVFGPWQRPEVPTLDNQTDGWDNHIVTNPSVCLSPDGRILMYYRSTGCRLGLAIAETPDHPFLRYGDGPVVDPGNGLRIEDPFVFWHHDHYEMVCKDLTGNITGEFHAAVHLHSPNGIDWTLADPVKAWSRKLQWEDGRQTEQASIERPYILFEDGEPAWLFAATADGPGPQNGRPGHYYAENTWNMVRPLTG